MNSLEEIKSQLLDAKKELNQLDCKYQGGNDAQRRTLMLLQRADAGFQLRHKMLVAKVEYLQSLYDLEQLEDTIRKDRIQEGMWEAMMDSI